MARAEPAWSTQDWAWDPVSLSAAPKAAPEQASARDAAMLMAAISPAAAPALGGLLSQALASQAQEHSTAKKPHRPTCQVPGCNADLQGSRAYYRRYRICEAHFRLTSFNMPSILNGVTCRFCQQCAKFEPITEFDGDKRSCKRQLARHNERRKERKEAAARQQVGTKRPAEDSPEDADQSGDSLGGRLVDGTLAALLQSSSLQRSSAGGPDSGDLTVGARAAAAAVAAAAATAAVAAPKPAACARQASDGLREQCSGSLKGDGYVSAQDANTAQATQAKFNVWGDVPIHKVHSRANSLSEMTVEVEHPKHGWDCDDGFDHMLAEAAQQLLAHWNHDTNPGTPLLAEPLVREAGASSDGVHLIANVPPPQLPPSSDGRFSSSGAVKQLTTPTSPVAQSTANKAGEQPQGDSSVHGPTSLAQMPIVPHGDDTNTAQVLSALCQSDCFNAIRGDTQPMVRDATAAAAPSSQHAYSAMQQQQEQLPPPIITLPSRQPSEQLHAAAAMPPRPPAHPAHALATPPHAAGQGSQVPDYYGGSHGPASSNLQQYVSKNTHGAAAASRPSHMSGSPGSAAPAWLMAQWNSAGQQPVRTRADMSSGGSSYSSMHDIVMPPGLTWPMHRMPSVDASAQSFSPTPQVPLHPLLASLPAADEPAPLPPPQATPPAANNSAYPNIWATPCPLPAERSQHGGPSRTMSQQLVPHGGSAAPNLARISGHSAKVERQAGPLVPGSGNTGHLAQNLGQASYILAEQSLTRLSIKLHGVTPEALPTELRSALTEWLAATDVRLLQGFIRPGCVHLSLDCMKVAPSCGAASSAYTGSAYGSSGSGGLCSGGIKGLDDLLQAGLATAGVAHMASALPRPLARLFTSCTIVELQSPNKLVLMEGEAVWSVAALDKRPTLPVIHSVQPLAILAGSRTPMHVYVHGSHLEGRGGPAAAGAASDAAAGGCQVLVRSAGRFFQQGAGQAVQPADGSTADSGKVGWWRVGVDTASMQPGLAVVECQTGRLLSNWRPILVVDDAGVHREILQLQPLQAQHQDKISAIITDLALLMQLQTHHQAAVASGVAGAGAWVREGVVGAESESESEGDESEDLSDDEDRQSETAPSVSEGPEGGYDSQEDEDGEVQGALREDHAAQLLGATMRSPEARGRGIAVAGAAARNMSWDTEAFGAVDVGTPMVHSSWGSTLNMSILAKQDPEATIPRPTYTRGDSGDSTQVIGPARGRTPAGATATSAADSAADPFTAEVRASLAGRALRLLAFACDAGWPCTVRLLLDLLTSLPMVPTAGLARAGEGQLVPMSSKDVLSRAVGGDGLTPLHRAARSGSAATVREVLNFARHCGLSLNPASRGAAPMSPLHLSAMCLEGKGSVAQVLLQSARDAPLQWFVSRAADGRTPAQLASETDACRHINDQARCMVQMLASKASRK